jgi:CRP/FNR family transcriptional regulator, cyclic AMP receptor protein
MTAETHPIVAHPFLSGLPSRQVEPLADHATWTVFTKGQRIFAEGGEADRFWLIEDGEIALDIQIPGRGLVTIETLGPWTVLGWSWLQPPYRWHFGAVTRQATSAIEIDARPVRGLLDRQPDLGYELTRRFLNVVVDRLQATRIRLLDLYGQSEQVRR